MAGNNRPVVAQGSIWEVIQTKQTTMKKSVTVVLSEDTHAMLAHEAMQQDRSPLHGLRITYCARGWRRGRCGPRRQNLPQLTLASTPEVRRDADGSWADQSLTCHAEIQ